MSTTVRNDLIRSQCSFVGGRRLVSEKASQTIVKQLRLGLHVADYETTSVLFQIKINLLLYLLYYAEACNDLTGTFPTSLRPINTASFEEISQQWRAIGNTAFDMTSPRFEPLTSCLETKALSLDLLACCLLQLRVYWLI